MARFFVSYSRVDRPFAQSFAARLERMFPNSDVWYDYELTGGDNWWEEILNAIKNCDIFIYLLSNESVQSPYCQAEFTEAHRLQKLVVTVQVRDRTKMTSELEPTQYVDMKAGVNDAQAVTDLARAINKQLPLVQNKRPLWKNRTLKPVIPDEQARPPQAPDVVTPTLKIPSAPPEKSIWRDSRFIIGAVIIPFAAALLGVFVQSYIQQARDSDGTRIALALTPSATQTPSITPTPEATFTPSATLEIALVVGTLDAQSTIDQATAYIEQTAAARATAYSVGTHSIIEQTQTATLWTPTPTANITASIEAFRTQQASTETQQYFVNLTATATLWTATPTSTNTPSHTPTSTPTYTPPYTPTRTPTNTPMPTPTATPTYTPTIRSTPTPTYTSTNTPSHTPTITPTPTPTNTPMPTLTPMLTLLPMQIGSTPIAQNTQWTVVEQDFDGVAMVLVPAGCFTMGSTDGGADEAPTTHICFAEPFWIDEYEVTNAQFAEFQGQAGLPSHWTGDNRPRESITGFEARNFCALRSARLPTEAEWEYAARGPDSLIYPWGNTFAADNVVYIGNSNNQTADVGSRTSGDLWVGAYDMSGNVWEWTSTFYQSYPYPTDGNGYVVNDGREDPNNRTDAVVVRGGSWNEEVSLVRAANRAWGPTISYHFIGLRCARDAG